MAEPNFAALEQAEAVAVRAALERGYLRPDDLRRALLIREQLRAEARPARLLQILGRYIAPAHQQELRGVYFEELGRVESGLFPAVPAEPGPAAEPDELLFSSEDELAIPEFVLTQSSEQLARAPDADPQAVQDYLVRSAEGLVGDIEDDPTITSSGIFRWLKRNLRGKG